MKGFVYIMSNKAMPGLVKIGYSTKHPELRAKELEGTGLPYEYIVEYCAFLENPFEIEQATHQRLADKNEAKEFFRVSIGEAVLSLLDTTRKMGVVVLYEEDVFGSRMRAEEEAERPKRKAKYAEALRAMSKKGYLADSDLKELSAIQLSLGFSDTERDEFERELTGEPSFVGEDNHIANRLARERQARLKEGAKRLATERQARLHEEKAREERTGQVAAGWLQRVNEAAIGTATETDIAFAVQQYSRSTGIPASEIRAKLSAGELQLAIEWSKVIVRRRS